MVTKAAPLALSRLTCQVPNYKSEISELSKGKSKELLYTNFIQKFLEYIPIDYRFRDRQELFGKFAEEFFEFFKNRPLTLRKIEIHNTIIENNPAINILILGDDKHFIVDSIMCLLTKLGLKAKFLLHPVINTKRNNDGELEEILSTNNKLPAKIANSMEFEGHLESLVHISILGNFDKGTINSLKHELVDTLDQVDTTHNIWQKLLDRVSKAINEITNHTSHHLFSVPRKERLDSNLDYNEAIDFLSWLKNNNFTFLGMTDFDLATSTLRSEEGVTRIWEGATSEIQDIIKCSASSLYQDQLIILGKVNTVSPVHRSNLVDYVLIKKIDKDGNYISGSIIFGLYSSAICHQSISNIPILRQKLNFVLETAGFSQSSYNTAKLKTIIESLPREALIQIDKGDLYCMCLHMLSSMMSRKLKLFIQQDWSGSFINIIIFLPKDRLTPEVHNSLNCYLTEKFGSPILSDSVAEVAGNFSYLFVILDIHNNKDKINFDIEIVEQELDKLSTRWNDNFYNRLSKEFGEYQGGVKFKLFEPIFPLDYKQKFSPGTALIDIEYLKKATSQQATMFNLISVSNTEFKLKIYTATIKLALSDILPYIENLGFNAIDEQCFFIKSNEEIQESWIYQFTLTSLNPIEKNFDALKINVEEALEKIASGLLASDVLNKLIVLSGLSWIQVKLVKALTKYLQQTGFIYSKDYVQLTLVKHFAYTKMLVDLFDVKFNLSNVSEEKAENLKLQITEYLNTITSSTEDKVLRTMFEITEAIVRTNCYQSESASSLANKNYFSFKFNSKKIPNLPLPVPYAEIFVYANEFEGIHLRGGKVARGGIRWSDRGEDFRTEVLGLMKAQMTKNAVIVPVGSKGGFFVNFTEDNLSRQQYMEKVIECYKNFLRGLLDITDNIVDGKVVQPKNTIIYDGEDPYLVVAADKGTATFSDYANSISAEYNYWLGDAFASGGSAGYDHKKMAITAKGAWISVKNHFQAMGVNIKTDLITVVGIGDMSGDVFGNGMLRSNAIKLVAAFNHKHIFIDPDPDPIKSYNERSRLFNLPRSNWSDYDLKVISKGGGVFERSSKSIPLSTEIKALLKISNDELPPESLIRSILQIDVDLLWNGGIGTYIKATSENNLEIGDKTNDNLRCNAKNIRAKVIAEGGNIGVSQQGRIEYSKYGGRINTDFIDNSAGVDCSDHEVNIKIALQSAMSSGKLSIDERNKLLFNMTTAVEELVLADNYKQTQAITIMQLSPALTIGMFSQFINALEAEKVLDRVIEFLPTEEELTKRALNKESMTRPELAVLLSYAKMALYHELSEANFPDDKYFESYLIGYFPKLMQEKFRDEILSHPLKHEIIRTVITNKIINQLSGPLINIIKRETGSALCDIIRAYTIIYEIFDLDNLWTMVESLPNSIGYDIKIDMFTELAKITRRGISWFVKHIEYPIDMNKTIDEFYVPTQHLSNIVGRLLVGEAKLKFDNKVKQYILSGVEESLAFRIATLDSLVSAFDIIYIAKQTKEENIDIANLYFATGNRFNIDWLRKACDKQINDSYWNRLSIQSLKDDLYDKQRRLLIKMINQSKSYPPNLDAWIENNKEAVNIFLDFVNAIKLQENIDINIIILAIKKFETLLRKLE